MTARTTRIDELLRQEMGSILSRDVEDPRIGFATIISIETTPDLRHAKVLVSVIGQPEDRKTTLNAMGRAMPFVRHELGKRLRIKRIPEFHLELDDTLERGTRVLHLLDELGAGRAPGEQPIGETLPTPLPRLPHEGDSPDAASGDQAGAEGHELRSKPRRTFR
ncbi:MAG TPA: 30S ribosome-binding factor RbfA, partial [Candidatus Limnocylindrales bacterium]